MSSTLPGKRFRDRHTLAPIWGPAVSPIGQKKKKAGNFVHQIFGPLSTAGGLRNNRSPPLIQEIATWIPKKARLQRQSRNSHITTCSSPKPLRTARRQGNCFQRRSRGAGAEAQSRDDRKFSTGSISSDISPDSSVKRDASDAKSFPSAPVSRCRTGAAKTTPVLRPAELQLQR